MSSNQIAQLIIAKNAIKKEIEETKRRLNIVIRDISCKERLLKVGIIHYSFDDIHTCEDSLHQLIDEEKQLTDRLDRLNNALSGINY